MLDVVQADLIELRQNLEKHEKPSFQFRIENGIKSWDGYQEFLKPSLVIFG